MWRQALRDSGLTGQGLCGLCETPRKDGSADYGLRYEELITLCIRQDFFDVQNRIPGASQVDTVSVQLYAGDSSYCETDDPAVLERAQALHRAALAQGEDMTGSSDRYMSIRLRYELKNGDTVRRDYTIACVSGTESTA